MKYLKKPVFIILIVVVIISIISIIVVNNMDFNVEKPINKPLIPANSDVCEEMTKTLCYEVKGNLGDFLRDNLLKVEGNTDRYEENSIYHHDGGAVRCMWRTGIEEGVGEERLYRNGP